LFRLGVDGAAFTGAEALGRAEALPELECPRAERSRRFVLSPEQESRLARLRAAREEATRRLGLAPGLLVNGATLERLACLDDVGGEAAARLLKNWQREALGESFLSVLQG
jgi:ribonuclease D